MPLYNFSDVNYGGIKKNTATVSKTIKQGAKVLVPRSPNGQTKADGFDLVEVQLADADELFLGSSPTSSLLNSIRILVHEPFDTGTTLNLYHSNVNSTDVMTTIKTGIVLDKDVSVIDVDMAVDSGVVKADGVTPADKGFLWTGSNVYMFGVILASGTVTKGNIEILYDYNIFDEDFKTRPLKV